MRRALFLTVLACGLGAAPARGQAVPSKEPSSTHIFPAGGRRGTTVPVRVGAECLPPGARLHLIGAGVAAPAVLGRPAAARYEPSPRRPPADADGGARVTYPREWQSKVTIAADAPLGAVQWRLTCGWGGTQPRPFVVGDLPEFIEAEPNSDPEHAERLTLPVTVNGQIAGERDIDFFTFAARAGDVVVCDVLAARIGSPLDPVVEVRDPRGRRVPLQTVRVGSDPVVAFRADRDGDYLLNIAHVGVRGGPEYVYRMTLSTAPYVPFAFPPGGRAGETRAIRFFALTGGDGFRTWTEKVTFPVGHGRPFRWRGVPLDVGDVPEIVAEGNRSADRALPLTLPVTVSGRFPDAGAEDWFRFQARKGEAYALACRPFPGASSACPVVELQDAGGNPLARASGADGNGRQCRLEWKAPADGVYRVRVRDLRHGARGGPGFLYRLTVRPARPDFALSVAADWVNLVQGGKAELDVSVRRTGGFTGPVELSVAGLPEGVRVGPARVPENQSSFKLVLSAGDVRPASAALRLTGGAVVGGKPCRRTATVGAVAGGPDGACSGLRTETVRLTVQHRPIFRLTCNEAYRYAARGTVYPYPLEVERLNGFEGEIVLQACDRQVQDLDGIEVRERVVPAGGRRIGALVYLPETMHANVQHHCRPYVQGYAFFTDRWGQRQAMLAVCEKRCMIRTLPPVVKLRAASSVVARRGGTATCKLVLERTSNFTGPVEVELVSPDAHAGFAADRARIEAGRSSVAVCVRVAKTAVSGKVLTFRATGQLPGDVKVVSEATVAMKLE